MIRLVLLYWALSALLIASAAAGDRGRHGDGVEPLYDWKPAARVRVGPVVRSHRSRCAQRDVNHDGPYYTRGCPNVK